MKNARIAILDQVSKLAFVRYVTIDNISINNRTMTVNIQVETNDGERIEAII